MQTATAINIDELVKKAYPSNQVAHSGVTSTEKSFPPLEEITRPTVTTEEAAYYLNRKPQTMRIWAMNENGLITPLRINGRLAWPVKEIKRVMGV